MKAVADKPADRDVDLRFAHQPAIMNDAKEKSRKHEPDRDFWIDARPAVLGAVAIGNCLTQPGQVKDPINTRKDMMSGTS